VITLDTSVLFASFNRRDPAHQTVANVVGQETRPPEAVLGEIS
jgi:predicted nucleic acid-binding protein